MFIFADEWRKNFSKISDQSYDFYYFSLCFNNCPVYRIYDRKEKISYDVYRDKQKWKITSKFSSHRFYDYSLSKTLHPFIPPLEGWGNIKFKKMMEHIIPKYHYYLAKADDNYNWWHTKYMGKISLSFREIIKTFILSLNKYRQKLPLEIIFIIFSNFRVNYNYN